MYRLRDFLLDVLNMEPEQIVSDELYCIHCDAKTTLLANQMHSTLNRLPEQQCPVFIRKPTRGIYSVSA